MNTMARLDLLLDPWIDVLHTDGSTHSAGLLEVSGSLGDIYDVSEADPLLRVAIRRILLAIEIAGGVKHLEQFSDRFQLDGPLPFFATTGLAEQFGQQYVRPEAQLALLAAQGGATLIDQRTCDPSDESSETWRSASWRSALADLLIQQAWAPGGLLSAPRSDLSVSASAADAPLAGRVSAWVVGPDLASSFEVMRSLMMPIPEDDAPTWCPPPGADRGRRAPGDSPRSRSSRGPLEALTWVSRRVDLLGSRRCEGVVVSDGDRQADQHWDDLPDVVWMAGKAGVKFSARVAPGKGIEAAVCAAVAGRLGEAVVAHGGAGVACIEATAMVHKQKAVHGSVSEWALVGDAASLRRCGRLGDLDRQIGGLAELGDATAAVRRRALETALHGGCAEGCVDDYAAEVLGVLEAGVEDGDTGGGDEDAAWTAAAEKRARRLIDEALGADGGMVPA